MWIPLREIKTLQKALFVTFCNLCVKMNRYKLKRKDYETSVCIKQLGQQSFCAFLLA
jgi:hypothetical protein